MNTSRRPLKFLFLFLLIIFLPILLLASKFRQRLLPHAALEKLEVTVDPLTATKNIGETLKLTVNVTTAKPLSGANLVFTFDRFQWNVVEVKGNTDKFSDDLSTSLIASGSGKILLSLVGRSAQTQLPRGPFRIGEITLQAAGAGTSSLAIDPATQIVGPADNGTHTLFEAYQLHDPQLTVLAGAGDPPKISFTTRINGITTQGPSLTARLRVLDPSSGSTRDFPVTLVSDTGGVYKPTGGWVTLTGVMARKPYTLLLKGPKHLQRRMETRKTLQVGDNTENIFNWTGTPLQPGDVPNPNLGNLQDGVANALDASLILERINSTDSSAASIADLNYDGVVNLNDFSLLISTLSTKNEDEQ